MDEADPSCNCFDSGCGGTYRLLHQSDRIVRMVESLDPNEMEEVYGLAICGTIEKIVRNLQ